jgi:uncharacterized protein involved in exopolysaccharide biosynthesis
MSEIVSLKTAKDRKKAAKIAEELAGAIKIMEVSIRGLGLFGKYSFVAEAISSLQTNKTLCEIHLSKYKKLCE